MRSLSTEVWVLSSGAHKADIKVLSRAAVLIVSLGFSFKLIYVVGRVQLLAIDRLGFLEATAFLGHVALSTI